MSLTTVTIDLEFQGGFLSDDELKERVYEQLEEQVKERSLTYTVSYEEHFDNETPVVH